MAILLTDKTAPKLVSSTPKSNSKEVYLDQDIVLTFDENVKSGKGNIIISSGKDIRTIAITDPEAKISGKTVTINPTNDLLSGSHYTVKFANTVITDASGNKFKGTSFAFDTVDIIAPTLVKSSPAINTSNVASNASMVLTLSEKIQAGTGSITLVSGYDSRTISLTDKQVKISGTTLTINPNVDFNVGSTYAVHLDAGAIKDLAPVSNSAVAIDFSLTTKATGDKQAPVLQSYLGKGAASTNLQLTFQESIKIGKGSFTLVNSADSKDKISISATDTTQVSIANNVLTINPKENLKPETTYLLTAPKGIVTDLVKNAFAGIAAKVPFKFNTHDTTAPELKISGEKATAINSPIVYTFEASEAIKDFTADDIVVTGGTKGEFKAVTGTNNFTLSVTPEVNSTKPMTVDVVAGKFTDVIGNTNVATSQNTQAVDTVLPTLIISGEKATTTNSAVIYTFTPSETITGFTVDDITVTGGTKGEFKAVTGTNNFTLSVTPEGNSTKPMTVDVAAGKFTDVVGNPNIATSQNIQAVDTVLPTLIISGEKATAINSPIVYTFEASEAIKDFTADDIVVTGGTKGEFKSVSGTNNFTLSVTPEGNSSKSMTVDVAAGKFTDVIGNPNIATSQNTQAVDTVLPTLIISGEKATAINSPIVYTFEASEAIKDFTAEDIVVTGGTKGEFKAITGTNNFTLSVTPEVNSTKPITVDVAAGKFSDVVGNPNVAALQNTQTVDTVAPTITITNNQAGVLKSGDVVYTFTLSEASSNFTLDDIIVTGGTKAATLTTVSSTVYTLSVTADTNSTTSIKVDVAAGKFTDIVGNNNLAASQNTQAVDTVPPPAPPQVDPLPPPAPQVDPVPPPATQVDTIPPTITITDDKPGVANGPIIYTFSLSEASNNFTLDDVVVTGGTKAASLTAVSSTVYTLSVTPNTNSTTPIKVDVAAGKFTDVVGNNNLAAPQNTQDVDTFAPTIKIEDNQAGVLKNGDVVYTFTLSEASNTFTLDDITITGGTKALTLTTVSPTVYTLSVTPNANSDTSITVDIAAGKFSDAVGNGNVAATQSVQEVNTKPINGTAIDGYLTGSDVFADTNGDGIWNAGEAKAMTDADGKFTLTSSNGAIVVSGGTDKTTGQAFKGVLKAPEGATAVTPLTTVQQGFVESGQTLAQAQASVAKAFGFSNTINLATYDPIAALTNASAADKAQATNLLASAAKIANFLVTAGETLKGAGGDKVTTANAGSALLKSLVSSIKSDSDGVIDLADKTLLKAVINDSAKEVTKTVTGATNNFEAKITTLADTFANVMKDATDNITAAVTAGGSSDALLTSMGNVAKFIQTGAAAKLQDVAKTLDPTSATALKDLASIETTLTGDAADKSISTGSTVVTPPVVTPPVVTTPDPTPPPVVPPQKAITYSSTTIAEADANDGSITSITLTLANDTYTGTNGQKLAGAVVTNFPTGLTAVVTKTSSTVATVTFTGKAAAHDNTNDISNLSIVLGNAAFTSGSAAAVTNASKSDLKIDFVDPPVITYNTATFSEAAANDGSISASATLTLANDTYTGINGNSLAGAVVKNVPQGLTAVVTKTSPTVATVTFTGKATAHANANDISNLSIAIGNTAFTSGSAAAVTNATKSNLIIDFVDPPVITYSTATFAEAVANDGSISASATLTLVNDTYTGTNGKPLAGAIVKNVPTGLTADVTKTSPTVATVTFTGKATAHANANDISNLTIAIGDAAFTSGSAAAVTNATKSNLIIDFADPIPKAITYGATEFKEAPANDGSIVTTAVLTLVGDKFSGTNNKDLAGAIFTNVPPGLTAVLTKTTDTTALLALTGNANAHATANNVANFTVTLNDNAFLSNSSIGVTGLTNNGLKITYADPVIQTLTYSSTVLTESIKNDGTISNPITLNLVGDKFVGTNSAALAGAVVTNIPAGLTAVLTKTSDTTATLLLNGNAATHDNAQDVNNLTVALGNNSFVGGKASNITGATTNFLKIDFSDAGTISEGTQSFLVGNATNDILYSKDATTVDGKAGSDTIVISHATKPPIIISVGSKFNGLDTVIGFTAADQLQFSGIVSLTKSVATGVKLATNFQANNIFIFDETPISIADAAAKIAADADVIATDGFIVIPNSQDNNVVTVYYSDNLHLNGTETPLVCISGTNINTLSANNFLV